MLRARLSLKVGVYGSVALAFKVPGSVAFGFGVKQKQYRGLSRLPFRVLGV